jgi:nucleotide-binding universal stress UspA family protein
MTAVEMITSEMEEERLFTPRPAPKSIVVATDGSDAAIASFNAAKLIRAHSDANIHVLSVLEPMPMPIMFPVAEGMLLPSGLEQSREQAQRAIVEEQIAHFDSGAKWSMDIRSGRAAESIVDFAREQEADLIIVGAHRHGLLGRVIGEETAMEIARLSRAPLLVAWPGMKRLPKRVIVAMDLNPDGVNFPPAMLEFIADSPSVSCVHVKPRSEFMGIDWADIDAGYELAMKDRFATVAREFSSVQIRPEIVVLHGETAHELADFASYSKAELVVVGVRRRRGRSRAIGGRMASRIIRQSECSVLVVPSLTPSDKPRTVPAGSTDVISDSRLWSKVLMEFTSRNIGRMVDLEVDDPEIGAMVEASHYPLLGADYDHRDGRLTITLGLMRGLDRHLSRTISNPKEISVLSISGRDTALSVKHDGGQTLLTF